jgi:NTE family protein
MPGSSVLYVTALPRTLDELSSSLDQVSWLSARGGGDGPVTWTGAGRDVDFEVIADVDEAVRRTRERYYALMVIDCRQIAGVGPDEAARQEAALHTLLARLRAERDPDRRFSFERVAVLIGGPDLDRTDRLMYDAGAHRVGVCLRDRALAPNLAPAAAARARNELIHQLWDLAQTVMTGRKLPVSALCAAGGGISGIYYELGVVKCLHDALVGFDVRDFDMYYGISAGAVVTSLLANRIHIDELLERFGGHRGDDLELELTLRHLNVGELPLRVRSTVEHIVSYLRRVRGGHERFRLANLAWQLAALAGPIFQTSAIERRLARFLSAPGRTNDFRELACRLYVGATDQDAREHVLFGEEGFAHVPISKAVQASTAIHPFFRSVEIGGRRYTDGFVTRTSNLAAAVQRGANLVFVIDPFLPLVSDRAGENARHGVLWGVLQDYKTVAYTRFERVTEALLRESPHVTCFTFVPSNRMRRLMARNPMASTDYDAIVVEAYRSTYRRFASLERALGPRLEEYGIGLDLAPVARTIERLDRMSPPRALALLAPDAGLSPAPPRTITGAAARAA